MNKCYFEIRQTNHQSLAADIAQHMQCRQNLGKVIIIGDRPSILMGTVRKQWYKLVRAVQKERSGTINAEKILRLTHTITHMHRMEFTTKIPSCFPNGHVFFITPDQIDIFPINTYSVYLTCALDKACMQHVIKQMPIDGLLVDYRGNFKSRTYDLRPKDQLKNRVVDQWQPVQEFFNEHDIDVDALAEGRLRHYEALDDALDTLLDVSREFLRIASDFQHTLELSRPAKLTIAEQRRYDILILLAHRVQALDPYSMASLFTYNLSDPGTFFLHDQKPKEKITTAMRKQIAAHHLAGRRRLANALAFSYGSSYVKALTTQKVNRFLRTQDGKNGSKLGSKVLRRS